MDTLDAIILWTGKLIILLLMWVVTPLVVGFLPVVFWRGWVWAYNSFGQHLKYRHWVRLFYLWKEHNRDVVFASENGIHYLIDAVENLDGRYGLVWKRKPGYLAEEIVREFKLPATSEELVKRFPHKRPKTKQESNEST